MSDAPVRVCSACGAEQGPYAVRCWICREPVPPAEGAPAAQAPAAEAPAPQPAGEEAAVPPIEAPVPAARRAVRPPPPLPSNRPDPRKQGVGSVFVFLACILLFVGVFAESPGLAILLLICMLPALIGVLQARQEIGPRGRLSPGTVIAAVVVAGMLVVGMTLGATVLSVALLCGMGDSMDLDGMFVVLGLVLIAALIGGIVLGARVAKNMVLGAGRSRRV